MVLLVIFLVVTLAPIHFASDDIPEIAYDSLSNPYVAGQLIVGYAQNTPAATKRSIRAQMQLEMLSEIRGIGAEVVKVRNERAQDVLTNLRRNPNIAFVEYDYLTTVTHTPNDPNYPSQVFLPKMNAPEAWRVTKGRSNVLVAVLDTGLRTTNRDLHNMRVSGYNIIAGNSNYEDDHGHGTMVTSVIAAEMDNGFGIAGVAPGVSFLAVKVMNSSGSGTYSDMIKGIEYAVSQGAQIVNMSIGGRSASTALKLAIDQAVEKGTVIVAAAGNEGTTSLSYPAAYPNVVGVGAVDINDNKMTYSNTGAGLTVVAGGTARVATFTDFISSVSGTSFAAPYVSGMIALMASENPEMTPDQVFHVLAETSTDLGPVGYDQSFGYGLINMSAAIEKLSAPEAVEPPVQETDITPPVITLVGEAQIYLTVGEPYIELGATASDDVDGDISDQIVITGSVDVENAGTYTLTYDVSDQAGNAADTVIRIVEVEVVSTVIEPDEDLVEEEVEEEYIDLEPETKWVRETEIIRGSVGKRNPTVTHEVSILTQGTLDIELSYTGRNRPTLSFDGVLISNDLVSLQVDSGTYLLVVSSDSNLNFTITLTHPEREVPIDIPLGAPEVIIYGQARTQTLLITLFIIALVMLGALIYRRRLNA